MKYQAKNKSSRIINPIERSTKWIYRYAGRGGLRVASYIVTIFVMSLFIYKIAQIFILKEGIFNTIPDIYQVLAIGVGALLFTTLAILKDFLTKRNSASKDASLTLIPEFTSDLEGYPAELQTADELKSYVDSLGRRLNALEAKAQLHRGKLDLVESEIDVRRREVSDFSMRHPDIWGEASSQTSQYANVARQYMISCWGATLLAIALSIYISFPLFDVYIVLLVAGNLIVSLSLVYLVSSSISIITGAPDNPRAIKYIKFLIFFFSVVLLLATTTSIFMRINSSGSYDVTRVLMLGIDFSLVILAGALHASYRIFSWARTFEKKLATLKKQRDSLCSQLLQINATLALVERVRNQQRERLKTL